MSLTREHIQEDLSVAYISAVAAKAGFDCGNPMRHDYGVDIEINPIEIDDFGNRITCGMPLRVQAKASHNFIPHSDGFIAYDLKIRNYNILARETGRGPPIILILYCMPPTEDEWLDIQDNSTTLKHCGFWISLRGSEKCHNMATKRIKIPLEQVFNETSLRRMMEAIQAGGYP
jgi:hypothetical protein